MKPLKKTKLNKKCIYCLFNKSAKILKYEEKKSHPYTDFMVLSYMDMMDFYH